MWLVRIEELDMEEVLVDRRLTNAEIASAISWVLGIDPHQITVFDVKKWSRQEFPQNPGLICETTLYRGEFPMRVAFYPRDDSVKLNRLEHIGRFCERLQCRGLVSDTSVNPAAMILLYGPTRFERVFIKLDTEPDVIEIVRKAADS